MDRGYEKVVVVVVRRSCACRWSCHLDSWLDFAGDVRPWRRRSSSMAGGCYEFGGCRVLASWQQSEHR